MGIDSLTVLFPGDDDIPEDEHLVVTDLPDGFFRVSGSDVRLLGASFEIDSPFATDNTDGTFTVRSE
jgi:hypothetical protein